MRLTRAVLALDCGTPAASAVLAFARAAAHLLDARAQYDVLDKRATAAFARRDDVEGVALTNECSALAERFGVLEAAVQAAADSLAAGTVSVPWAGVQSRAGADWPGDDYG